MGKGPKEDLDQNGQQDNGYSVVVNKIVEKAQYIEEWLCNDVGPPEIDRSIQMMPKLFQDTKVSRAQIKLILVRGPLRRI